MAEVSGKKYTSFPGLHLKSRGDGVRDAAMLMDNVFSAPTTVSGKFYLYVEGGALKFDNGSGAVTLSSGGGGGVPSWETLFSNDSTFALTATTWTISQSAAASVLTLNKTNVGAGDVLSITNSGSGADIGNSVASWYIKRSAATGIVELGSGGSINVTDGALTIGKTGTATTLLGTLTVAEAVTFSAGGVALTTGNLVVSSGNFTVSSGVSALTSTSNAAASLSVVNNTATTYGAAAASGVVEFSSTSLTTGTLLHLELTEGTLNGGYYLRAWDVTAGAAVFSVAEDGVLLIAGTAGSNSLTLTAGDVVFSDGSVAITDADNAASFTVTNSTATTASVFVLVGAGVFTGTTTTSFATITTAGLTSGTVLYMAAAGLTTGKVVDITATAATDGILVNITGGGANMSATGRIAKFNMGAATVGQGLEVVTTGVYTGAGLATFTANSATTSAGLVSISGTGLTDGKALSVTGGGANMSASGYVIAANMGAATAGTGFGVFSTGVYTGTTGILSVTANSATTGVLALISANGLTSGVALNITATEATLTTGKYIQCYDGAAADFSVGKYGATVIAGNASTNVLTITAGNAVITAGNATLTLGNIILTEGTIITTPQAIVNANTAISVTHGTTTIANNAPSTHTLADGVPGQKKRIICTVYTGDAVITPANLANGTTITLNAVGDGVDLEFLGTEWWAVNLIGATAAVA